MIKQYCYIYKPSIDESKGLVNRLADFTSLTGSLFISAPLVVRIINQDHQLDDCRSVQQSIKRRIQQTNRTKQKEEANNLQSNLPSPLQRSKELAQEKGASTWLTALPIEEHGFALHKAALRHTTAASPPPAHATVKQQLPMMAKDFCGLAALVTPYKPGTLR